MDPRGDFFTLLCIAACIANTVVRAQQLKDCSFYSDRCSKCTEAVECRCNSGNIYFPCINGILAYTIPESPNKLICEMKDYLSVKTLLPNNCTVNFRSKRCQSTNHFCRCSPNKEEIIPVSSTCLDGPPIPSQQQCSSLYPPPPAKPCAPPSAEQCSYLFPPLTTDAECAPQVAECDPQSTTEVSTCTPCPSQENVTTFNTPISTLVTNTLPAVRLESAPNVTEITDQSEGVIKSRLFFDFINGFAKDKKDTLIVILGALNIIQLAIILFCELCRTSQGSDEKGDENNDVQVESVINNDLVPMDKRSTCEADDYMIPIVELTSGNFLHIHEAETPLEQVQDLEAQQQNADFNMYG